MRSLKKFVSLLVIVTLILSLSVPAVLAAGTVTVTYDTGVTYQEGGVVLLTAHPSGISNISGVAFYDGSTLLGSVTAAPYTFNYINLPLGARSITAQVTDSESNVTASEAVTVNVSAAPPVKTLLAGSDFASYQGGSITVPLNVNLWNLSIANITNTTSAPNWAGNNCVKVSGLTTSEAYQSTYRIYLANNLHNYLNTENKKIEISMDMCFNDFTFDRLFFRFYGAKDSAGTYGATSMANTPITFKANKTIVYTNDNAAGSSTLKTNGNTGSTLYLTENTWYNFKLITWIDGTNRKWEFYINGTKALNTMTMYPSGKPSGDNTMYYCRNSNYNYALQGANATQTSTTYFDNIYQYQYQDTPVVTASISTPADGSSVTAGSPVTLTSTAGASDFSAIQKVQYYQNGQLIGESAAAPYTVSATLPAGSYSITARAVSAVGYNGYSAPVALTVNNPRYTVAIDAGPGGTVSADPIDATVDAGQTVEFTIVPDPDYEIGTVTFDENPVTVSNGIYITPPLTGNTTLSVTFVKKEKSPPAITIVNPFHVGQQTFNGVSALSGKSVNNLVIDSSFIAYATISNPDEYTIESFGMYLKDTVSNKTIELPMLYPIPGDQFAFQLYGAGFQLGRQYSLQGYVNYKDDQNTTQLVLSEEVKTFDWE